MTEQRNKDRDAHIEALLADGAEVHADDVGAVGRLRKFLGQRDTARRQRQDVERERERLNRETERLNREGERLLGGMEAVADLLWDAHQTRQAKPAADPPAEGAADAPHASAPARARSKRHPETDGGPKVPAPRKQK